METASKIGESIFIDYTFTKRGEETEWTPEVTISNDIDSLFEVVYIREADLPKVISLLTSKLEEAKKYLAKNPNF
jgi:hypothetical protein